MEVSPTAKSGWVFLKQEKLPETLFGYEWLGGIRYDSEKKAIIEWEEEPLPPPVDEIQVLKDKVAQLEARVGKLESTGQTASKQL